MNQQEKVEYLKLVEQHSRAHAEFGVAVAEKLSKDSGALLSILIAGIGGGIALTIQLIKESSGYLELIFGLGVTTLYLTAIAVVLVVACIKTRHVYPPTNSPINMLAALDKKYESVSLSDAVKSALYAMDGPIDKNRQSNELVAKWLDRCRMATVLTPVVFVVTSVSVYLL